MGELDDCVWTLELLELWLLIDDIEEDRLEFVMSYDEATVSALVTVPVDVEPPLPPQPLAKTAKQQIRVNCFPKLYFIPTFPYLPKKVTKRLYA